MRGGGNSHPRRELTSSTPCVGANFRYDRSTSLGSAGASLHPLVRSGSEGSSRRCLLGTPWATGIQRGECERVVLTSGPSEHDDRSHFGAISTRPTGEWSWRSRDRWDRASTCREALTRRVTRLHRGGQCRLASSARAFFYWVRRRLFATLDAVIAVARRPSCLRPLVPVVTDARWVPLFTLTFTRDGLGHERTPPRRD